MSEVPVVSRYTLQDLDRITSEADSYINEAVPKGTAKRRRYEVIETLNSTIKKQYLHQIVSVYGLHKKIARDKKGNLHSYLKNGVLEGMSDGFIVTDFEEDFSDIGAEESVRQGDMLANLKEFAPGRYAVSHLVRLTTMEGHTDDFLLQQTLVTRGFSPAFASQLFLEEPADIPTDSEILESERVAALSTGLAARQMEHIESLLQTTDDPLPVLVNNARKFRGLAPSDQYGMKRLLASRVSNDLFGSRYRFSEGLPIFFQQNPDGTGSGPVTTAKECEIFIAGLDKGPHYHFDKDSQYGRITDETGLYVIGYMIENDKIDSTLMVIPLESLKDSSIVRKLDD